MARIIRLDALTPFSAVSDFEDPGHIKGKIIIPNGVRVILQGALGDSKTWHMDLGGEAGGSFQATIGVASALYASFSSGTAFGNLLPLLSTTWTFTNVVLRDMRQLDQPFVSSTNGAAVGSSPSAELPDETALVVTLRTALSGPGNRGRVFMPGWAQNALASGNVASTAAVTALQAWALTWANTMAGQGLTHCLLQPPRKQYTSNRTGTNHDARPAGTPHITQTLVRDNHWDTQRRRGLK